MDFKQWGLYTPPTFNSENATHVFSAAQAFRISFNVVYCPQLMSFPVPHACLSMTSNESVLASGAFAQVTLFPFHFHSTHLLQVPEMPFTQAKDPHPSPLSPTQYSCPSGHVHFPPQPPAFQVS